MLVELRQTAKAKGKNQMESINLENVVDLP